MRGGDPNWKERVLVAALIATTAALALAQLTLLFQSG